MNDDNILRQRHKAMERATLGNPYSAKDFQLEVLDRLAEMRSFAEALDESWEQEAAGGEGAEAAEVRQPDVDCVGGSRALDYGVRGPGLREIPRDRIRKSRRRRHACSDWNRSRRRIRRRGFGQKFSWANCAMHRMRSRL